VRIELRDPLNRQISMSYGSEWCHGRLCGFDARIGTGSWLSDIVKGWCHFYDSISEVVDAGRYVTKVIRRD
jgi:hypothetical protein